MEAGRGCWRAAPPGGVKQRLDRDIAPSSESWTITGRALPASAAAAPASSSGRGPLLLDHCGKEPPGGAHAPDNGRMTLRASTEPHRGGTRADTPERAAMA
jgi:hypothetical protein